MYVPTNKGLHKLNIQMAAPKVIQEGHTVGGITSNQGQIVLASSGSVGEGNTNRADILAIKQGVKFPFANFYALLLV